MLQAGPADDDGPPRPAWQWIVFGALAIITVWVPAAAIAGALASRLASRAEARGGTSTLAVGVAIPVAYAVALAAGAVAGGYLVGRWGTAGTGLREATLAGFAAAIAATAASWLSLGPAPGELIVPLITVPASVVGGMLGLRRRAGPG